MTARQLESRIGAFRASVRRLLALHGLSWVFGLLVPLLIVSGFADWLFHLDAVIRAALLAVLIGPVLYGVYRRRAPFVRFADSASRRIEGMAGLFGAGQHDPVLTAGCDDRYGSGWREAIRQAIERPARSASPGDRSGHARWPWRLRRWCWALVVPFAPVQHPGSPRGG